MVDEIMAMNEVELRAVLMQLAGDEPAAAADAVARTLKVTRGGTR